MTIKDFKVGQEAFIMLPRTQGWQLEEKDLIECIVQKVGSKYVYVKHNNSCCPEQFFQQEEKDNFLMKHNFQQEEKDDFLIKLKEYGDSELLFLTRAAAFEYVEKRIIINGLQYVFNYPDGYNRFTLEQLREVEEILNI